MAVKKSDWFDHTTEWLSKRQPEQVEVLHELGHWHSFFPIAKDSFPVSLAGFACWIHPTGATFIRLNDDGMPNMRDRIELSRNQLRFVMDTIDQFAAIEDAKQE